MKKIYSKPLIEIELYALDTSIALNCMTKINLGPEAPGKTTCSDFEGAFDVMSLNPNGIDAGGSTPFYADGAANCDCYYTSGTDGYFTS